MIGLSKVIELSSASSASVYGKKKKKRLHETQREYTVSYLYMEAVCLSLDSLLCANPLQLYNLLVRLFECVLWLRGDYSGLFDTIRREERKVGQDSRSRGVDGGGRGWVVGWGVAVVAHDIICFVEGGSQEHLKRRAGRD